MPTLRENLKQSIEQAFPGPENPSLAVVSHRNNVIESLTQGIEAFVLATIQSKLAEAMEIHLRTEAHGGTTTGPKGDKGDTGATPDGPVTYEGSF